MEQRSEGGWVDQQQNNISWVQSTRHSKRDYTVKNVEDEIEEEKQSENED